MKKNISINPRFIHHSLQSIMYLNEFSLGYPNAISLSAGRPAEQFFRPDELLESLPIFYEYVKEKYPKRSVNSILGQYGPSAGLIREIVSEHLKVDYKISAQPEDIVLTLGCQEGLELCTKVLFDKDDVLLLPEPIFVGITGSAIINDVKIWPFEWDGAVFDEALFEQVIQNVKASNKVAKAIYMIPDYNNPFGTCLNIQDRKKLIAFAKKHDLQIIEDGTYGLFNYAENSTLPALKALDKDNVIYVGSAAKTIYPALRIGYLVAGQSVVINQQTNTLANIFAQAKSFMSVNTPAMDQAMFAALLLKNDYSLKNYCEPQMMFNKNNLQSMLSSLESKFPRSVYNDTITWNAPHGGYFVVLKLPFVFGLEEMRECARDYNVLVTPMTLLSVYDKPRKDIRLAFTNVESFQIQEGIDNLARFVTKKLQEKM